MGKVKEEEKIDIVIEKLEEIENYFKKFMKLIPQEDLEEYENSKEIKKAYNSATKIYPPI